MDFREAENFLGIMPSNMRNGNSKHIVPLEKDNSDDNDLKYLLNVGLEAVSELVEIARNSENIRAYDSLSKMLKVVSDIKFRIKENSVTNNNKIINNSVFIATTKSIIDSISEEIDKVYDLSEEEIKLIEESSKKEKNWEDEEY